MTLHKRIDPGTHGQCEAGAFESIAGSECTKDTADTPNRQPRPLVIERGGLIRFATADELRRIARLGFRGALA